MAALREDRLRAPQPGSAVRLLAVAPFGWLIACASPTPVTVLAARLDEGELRVTLSDGRSCRLAVPQSGSFERDWPDCPGLKGVRGGPVQPDIPAILMAPMGYGRLEGGADLAPRARSDPRVDPRVDPRIDPRTRPGARPGANEGATDEAAAVQGGGPGEGRGRGLGSGLGRGLGSSVGFEVWIFAESGPWLFSR